MSKHRERLNKIPTQTPEGLTTGTGATLSRADEACLADMGHPIFPSSTKLPGNFWSKLYSTASRSVVSSVLLETTDDECLPSSPITEVVSSLELLKDPLIIDNSIGSKTPEKKEIISLMLKLSASISQQ